MGTKKDDARWWRAFYEAVERLVNEGASDQQEIDRIATAEADDALVGLTVSALQKELESMPQDAPVWLEGCDCDGECVSVALDSRGYVYLEREHGA